MSTKSKYHNGGHTEPSFYEISEGSAMSQDVGNTSSGGEGQVYLTEGGSGGIPLVPTIRHATAGAVKEVLSNSGVATEEDINRVEQKIEYIQEKISGVEEDIDPLATKDGIRNLLEAHLD